MIIKRKLFSKTSKEKREMVADNLDRTRKGVATIYGGLAGAGILASNFIKDEKHRGVDKQVIIHYLKDEKKLDKEFEKIRSTGDKVRELAKKRIKTGNPIVGLANAINKAHASEELTKKAAERLKDRISKKASKRNKKIAIGAAVVGTAVGLASNHKMKKNAEKLRAKKLSLKRGLVGAGIGSATGAAIATAGHLHHKSEARKAREELKRRGKE